MFHADYVDMEIWERVKRLIKEQNTTQEWLAKQIGPNGIPSQTLRRWISHNVMCNADQAFCIAKALGVSVEFLLTGLDTSDPWIRENRSFIDDCKSLPLETFEAMVMTIHLLADSERSKVKHA